MITERSPLMEREKRQNESFGLDSSGIVASVAVVEDDILVAEYTVNYKKTHSQTFLPMLDEIVKMTELDLKTIDAIAVAKGPGSLPDSVLALQQPKDLDLPLKNHWSEFRQWRHWPIIFMM